MMRPSAPTSASFSSGSSTCCAAGSATSSVWLFGSRARGDAVSDLSDIDVLVIADRAGWLDAAPV